MFTKINDRYKIQKQIGKGGFATVYLAWDELIEREVALKIAELKPGSSFNARREVKLVSKLNHPNIIRYYDLLEHQENDIDYEVVVMEYANNGNLEDFIYDNSFRAGMDMDEIFMQILQGMQYYHQSGIVHKDLKPQNILLHKEEFTGRILPKISDFFISNYQQQDFISPYSDIPWHKTVTAPNLGTPEYMSPEQIMEGQRGQFVERRSDIWSFGVILYETLKKEHPFGSRRANDRSTIIATNVVIEDEMDISGIPAPYDEMIRLCLEKNLRKRIGDTSILIELLQKKKETGQPSQAQTQILEEKLKKQFEEIQLFTVALRADLEKEIHQLQEQIKGIQKSPGSSSKKELMDLLRNNEIEMCFEALNEMENNMTDQQLRMLINLQGQWTDNKTMAAMGMLEAKEESLAKNKIRAALIELIASLKYS